MDYERPGYGPIMADNTTENLKGSAKEIAGKFSGDEDLEKEGRAQQEKSRKKEEAEAKKAEAAKAEQQAAGQKGQQKAHED